MTILEILAQNDTGGEARPIRLHVYRDDEGRACGYVVAEASAGPAARSLFGTDLPTARRAAADLAAGCGASAVLVFDPLGLVHPLETDQGLHPDQLNAANDG